MFRRSLRRLAYSVSPSLKVEPLAAAAAPSGSEVSLTMLAAPVTRGDLSGGKGPAGLEGAGLVTAVGSSVSGVAVGDVVQVKSGKGTFRSFLNVPQSDVFKIPEGLPPAYAALAGTVAAQALRILSDFGPEGGVIVQNCAEQPVGVALAQLARAKGLTTVNVLSEGLMDAEDAAQLVSAVAGEDSVVCDAAYLGTPAFKRLAEGLGPVMLGVDAVGAGRHSAKMVQAMDAGATIVTHGAVAAPKASVSGLLPGAEGKAVEAIAAAKGLNLGTFSMQAWNDKASAAEREAMLAEVHALFMDGTLDLFVEEHPLHDFEYAAKRVGQTSRAVVLTEMDAKLEDVVADIKASL